MPKFLVEASYTKEGFAGVQGKGGTSRRDAVEQMVSEMGGTLESFYFSFGEHDAYVLVDVPTTRRRQRSRWRSAPRARRETTTIVLLTAEQVDEAARRSVSYRAPGN